jgi:hypothetical protein
MQALFHELNAGAMLISLERQINFKQNFISIYRRRILDANDICKNINQKNFIAGQIGRTKLLRLNDSK